MQKRKKLLIGSSDYQYLMEQNAYFVDKTLFIQEILDSSYHILLIPRPRRFGKSLNLSMLQYYLDIAKKIQHNYLSLIKYGKQVSIIPVNKENTLSFF